MKLILNLTLLFSCLFLVNCSEPKAEEPDELAERIFEKLKENDQEGFDEITMHDEDEFRAIFESTIDLERPGISEEEKEEVWDKFVKHELPRMKEKVSKSFSIVRQEAESDGVDWPKAKFVKAEYKVSSQKSMEKADILITLECNGKEYELLLDDCIKIEGEWFLSDDMRWRGNPKLRPRP